MNFVRKIAVALLISCVLNGCFYERPFAYPARIIQQGDTPCFAIERNNKIRKAPRAVVAVSVNSYNSIEAPQKGAAQEVWTHHYFYDKLPHGTTSYFITPAQCILYNDDSKAPALEAGKKYSVDISTSTTPTGNGTRRIYYGYFCLSKDQSGNVAVHQVKWDDRKDGFNWDICK